MGTSQQCSLCGSLIAVDAPRGLCLECLVRLAEAPSQTSLATDNAGSDATYGGNKFGDYELLRQIGRGGMGVVYEARQVSLNRLVALKMIVGGNFASPSALRRFRIEAEAAAKLAHPNIVAIYEFGEHEGLPFFSMQRIEGTTLHRQMGALALSCVAGHGPEKNARKSAVRQAQLQVAKLISTLAHALHHAHQHGVIHCDVKPGNVLIDAHGQPFLSDFGIARFIDHDGQLTKSGVIGSPRYMSPEQAAGDRDQITASTDIYSLGVILYELLTGQPPFRGTTPSETLRQVTEREPVAPRNLNPFASKDLATICIKCLQKQPPRRYASAAELADDLDRWTRQEPIVARRVTSAEKFVRWCRRKPAIATLAGSVTLLLLTVAIGSALFASRLNNEAQQRARTLRVLRTELERELDELWKNPARASVTITSEKRSVLMPVNVQRLASGGVEKRLSFGVYTFHPPSAMARNFAPVLASLERSAGERLGRAVRIDLVIYRSYTNGHAGLLSGEVDFMRMGPASYVLLKEKQPYLTLLVAQENVLQGAIFTAAVSGVDRLAELKGKSFAFGDPESTFGTHLAQLALVRAGLRAADLSPQTRHFPSHDTVVEAVKSGSFAAGAANRAVLDPEFKLLHVFTNLNLRMPFVARSGIDPMVLTAIKESLLAERTASVLTNIEPNLTGFTRISDEEYGKLRDEMKAAKAFGELRY